jgi:hypothetical protein
MPNRQRGCLGQVADPRSHGPRTAGHVEPVDLDAARARGEVAGDHPDRGRLAGPVGPEEAHDLAGRHREVDAVDGERAAVSLGQTGGGDHRIRRELERRRGARAAEQDGDWSRRAHMADRTFVSWREA